MKFMASAISSGNCSGSMLRNCERVCFHAARVCESPTMLLAAQLSLDDMLESWVGTATRRRHAVATARAPAAKATRRALEERVDAPETTLTLKV